MTRRTTTSGLGSADQKRDERPELNPAAETAARLGRAQSLREAEERYVVARDAWLTAMRAANSGTSRDLATLAIAQEAFEAATADRDAWLTGNRVAVPVDPDKHAIDAVVGQEFAWRQVHTSPDRPGVFRRLKRRLTGR